MQPLLLPQAEKLPDIASLVAREQAKLLAANRIGIVSANSLVAWTIAIIMWQRLPTELLTGWVVLVTGLNLVRLIGFSVALRSGEPETNPERFLRQSWIGALASGIAWALLCVVSAECNLPLDPAVGICISGITAGAAIHGGIHRATVLAFIIPLELTNIVTILFAGSVQAYMLSFDVSVYLCMLLISSKRAESAFRAASQLKNEAAGLATSLAAANDVAAVAMQRLQEIADRDPLTGLANRACFRLVAEDSMRATRSNNSRFALALIDLDRFKSINDTFGHAAGDEVLIEVARRLVDTIGSPHGVARLGGDEFAIVLTCDADRPPPDTICGEIVSALTQPIIAAGRSLSIGCSIGFAVDAKEDVSLDDLQAQADLALYAVKMAGRGYVRGFDDELRATAIRRRTIEQDLRTALSDQAVEVWFQPQVRISDHRLVGLESQLRWNHPVYGWLEASDIVAAAHATQQLEALTAFELTACCRMVRALTEVSFHDVTISFNAAVQGLGCYSLADLVTHTAASQGVSVERLQIDLTETAILRLSSVVADLSAISEMGMKIAINDFAVQAQSLNALRNHAIDCLKIGTTVVNRIAEDVDARILVDAILGIGRARNLRTVAQGVATAEQALVLATLGCTEAQGDCFAKPMSFDDVFAWLPSQPDTNAHNSSSFSCKSSIRPKRSRPAVPDLTIVRSMSN